MVLSIPLASDAGVRAFAGSNGIADLSALTAPRLILQLPPSLRDRSCRHARRLRGSRRVQELTKTNIREFRPVRRCLCRGQSPPVALGDFLEAQPALMELIDKEKRGGVRPRDLPHLPLLTPYAKFPHRRALPKGTATQRPGSPENFDMCRGWDRGRNFWLRRKNARHADIRKSRRIPGGRSDDVTGLSRPTCDS